MNVESTWAQHASSYCKCRLSDWLQVILLYRAYAVCGRRPVILLTSIAITIVCLLHLISYFGSLARTLFIIKPSFVAALYVTTTFWLSTTGMKTQSIYWLSLLWRCFIQYWLSLLLLRVVSWAMAINILHGYASSRLSFPRPVCPSR